MSGLTDTFRKKLTQLVLSFNHASRARAVAVALLGVDLLHRSTLLIMGPFPRVSDGHHYWGIGANIAAGRWDFTHGFPRPPGYPVFLALMQAALEDRAAWTVALTQHGLSAGIAVAAGLFAWWLTGHRVAGLVAYGLLVLNVPVVIMPNAILSENLFLPLLAMANGVLVIAAMRSSFALAVLAGCFVGAATLVKFDAQLLFLIGFLPALTALVDDQRVSRARIRRLVLVGCGFTLGFALVLLPGKSAWLSTGENASSTLGIALWWSAYSIPGNCHSTMCGGANLPFPASADDEIFGPVKGACAAPDLRSTFDIFGCLIRAGASPRHANDLMTRVALEGIWGNFVAYTRSVAWQFSVTYWASTHRSGVDGRLSSLSAGRAGSYHALVDALYRPNKYTHLLLWYAALFSLIWSVRVSHLSTAAIIFLATMLYFAAVTAVVAVPMGRYHLSLVPLMAVSLVLPLGRLSATPSGVDPPMKTLSRESLPSK